MADSIRGDTASSQTLSIGSSQTSAIDFAGDTDWWKVSLQAGFSYQVWLEGLSAGVGTLVDPYLAIYNSSGTFQLSTNDISVLNWDSYTYLYPSSTGSYFLSAEAYGNKTAGTYRITIWQDELSSVATSAAVAVNSISAAGHLGWQGDISDWYAVTLTSGVQYQIDLIGSAGDGNLAGLTLTDPYLVLRNSAGVQLLANDDSGLGKNARIVFTPLTTGIYYLDAQEFGNDSFGTYQIIVNSAPIISTLTLNTPLTGSIGFAALIFSALP